MKLKYLIGAAIALVFVVVAIYSFDTGKIEYSDFVSAKTGTKVVQIIGAPIKTVPSTYDSQNNKFEFALRDEKQGEAKVVFSGSKPNNFDIAPMVVVKGKFEGDKFMATEVLTKCPSKYEGKMENGK